jgi:hypothetical protein
VGTAQRKANAGEGALRFSASGLKAGGNGYTSKAVVSSFGAVSCRGPMALASHWHRRRSSVAHYDNDITEIQLPGHDSGSGGGGAYGPAAVTTTEGRRFLAPLHSSDRRWGQLASGNRGGALIAAPSHGPHLRKVCTRAPTRGPQQRLPHTLQPGGFRARGPRVLAGSHG